MNSLRTRLFVFLVGGALALFLVAGIALRWTMGRWLQAEFDRALEAKARALVALTEFENGRIDFDFDRDVMPEFAARRGAEYFELWLAAGSLVQRSPSFDRDDATRQAALLRVPTLAPWPRFADLRLPDGRRGRQVRIDFVPRTDGEEEPDMPEVETAPDLLPEPSARPTVILLLARTRESLDRDLTRLSVAVAAVGAVLILALAALTQGALRVGLRSLDRLHRQVRALGADSLGRRVDVPAPPAEIAVVIDQLNALLARLEAAFARERRLSSDIAHELKTPIAELRSLCEVGARWPDDRAAVQAFFQDARAISLQMERIVVHLVALARCDEGHEPVRIRPVDVAGVVEAAWTPLAREAASRRLSFHADLGDSIAVQTDPDKFLLIVANLLANAVTYSTQGGAIAVAAGNGGGRARVTFSNPTDNLEPVDLAVMFDRFWRKDEARAGGHHAGLGLSLVRALADLLAIEISTRLDEHRTFHVTLTCQPAAAPAPPVVTAAADPEGSRPTAGSPALAR